jgi:hypothetical protein
VKTFQPMNEAQLSSLIAKTQEVAMDGKYELFKTSAHFDTTARHPDWLGSDTPAVQKLAPQLPGQLSSAKTLLSFAEKSVHLRHHLECIGHVHYVGLGPCPSAVCIKTDGAALRYESPAYNVRFLTVAACG